MVKVMLNVFCRNLNIKYFESRFPYFFKLSWKKMSMQRFQSHDKENHFLGNCKTGKNNKKN